MGALSQSGFRAFTAIAKRALAGLEGSSGANPGPEALAAALDAILDNAEQFGNEVNVKAEETGCSWMEEH